MHGSRNITMEQSVYIQNFTDHKKLRVSAVPNCHYQASRFRNT